ncbi:MAG: hypothetical protein M5U08_26160 [Burkholderiales bacterium]|nr:hypothetical protein [Burkholderiales bacterium]
MRMRAVLVACALVAAAPVLAQQREKGEPNAAAAERRAQALVAAVVRVRMKALPDARSSGGRSAMRARAPAS